ncbi:MAG TPA: nucleotide exchange factor GrpE [Rhizomicrobium sp.]|jgi:molecular chaperone GrpE|nr:nucleotide exchange factor GrpE [Rhizomicrobium sp.]
MNGDFENPENEAGVDAPSDALKAEVADLKDRLLRALADGENTRRRAERDKLDASQYAVTKFARDMLQIADNFARALEACPREKLDAADPQVKAVIEGVEVTERQLLSTLERYGVKQIETEGAKFDPNLHQAIAEVPGEGRAPGTIVTVVQHGYTIGDRLLRPAMVTVARKESGAPDPSQGGFDTRV